MDIHTTRDGEVAIAVSPGLAGEETFLPERSPPPEVAPWMCARRPVVERTAPRRVLRMPSRSDLLSAHKGRLAAATMPRGKVACWRSPRGRRWAAM